MAGEIECLETRCLLSTYFVNAVTGSDLNRGRSVRTPWQTLSAVNAHVFRRGDKVLLSGTFSGESLVLGTNASGVTVNSYTYNPATRQTKAGVPNSAVINNIAGDGIDISTSNVTVENLIIIASPASVSSGAYSYGINLQNHGPVALTRETINHVTVSGFSYAGLCMQGWNTSTADSAGFSNVLIENSSFFANQVSGIFVGTGNTTGNEFASDFPADFYANSNLTIKNCQAYNNAGYNPALTATYDGTHINNGNFASGGIFISSVNGATVQNCTAYNNCFNANGSVGIWAFDSTRVNFQSNESYDNKTAGAQDGDGFDFDHGVTRSIMQQDFSHGNAGIGFFLTTYGGSSNNTGDTIRYCISDADSLGGILIFTIADVPVLNANIYNNTILAGNTAGLHPVAISLAGGATASDSVNVLNNIFYTDGTGTLITDTDPAASVQFLANDYWIANAPGTVSISWGGTTYTSLAEWITAAAQETAKGVVIGQNQDPALIGELISDLPKSSVANLALTRTSPLRRKALNLASRPYAAYAGTGWSGIGKFNFFNHPINPHQIGAG